jgi:DNA-binding transcriptional LysR family regulator
VLCAAASVVARLGMPSSLDDLARYGALVYHRDGWSEPWLFPSENRTTALVEPRSRFRVADLDIIFDAAVSGHGIAWLPDWPVEDALAAGQLIPLLPNLPERHHDVHLLRATAPPVPSRLQIAIDALSKAGV